MLHMLRMLLRDPQSPQPDQRFFDLMRDFATTFDGQDATTADFASVVDRHLTPELDATGTGSAAWFFDQWVYGTELPRYSAELTVEKADKGRFRIRGTLTQSGVSDSFLALVPVYVDLGDGRLATFGRAPFRGSMTRELDVTLELPRKPKRVGLNFRREVLALEARRPS